MEPEPLIWVHWSRGIWLWPRDGVIYKNEPHVKLLRPLKSQYLGAFKSLPLNSFLYMHLMAKVKRLPFISPNLGVPILLDRFVKIRNYQKWERFWETLRITPVYTCIVTQPYLHSETCCIDGGSRIKCRNDLQQSSQQHSIHQLIWSTLDLVRKEFQIYRLIGKTILQKTRETSRSRFVSTLQNIEISPSCDEPFISCRLTIHLVFGTSKLNFSKDKM